MSRTVTADEVEALRAAWAPLWPRALAAWGRFTRLHPPVLHDPGEAPDGVGSFAWFSCSRVEVHIDLADVARRGLGEHGLAVLAHEVGHHVLSPGDLSTSARLLARARAGLVDVDDAAPLVSNLWSDLLINDRLQRRAGVAVDAVWRALGPPDPGDVLMLLVMRADELLWSLPSGSLTGVRPPQDVRADVRGAARALSGRLRRRRPRVPEVEAQLLARLVRAYADDPAGGIGGFAALVRQLLAGGADGERQLAGLAGGRGVVCAQHGEQGGTVAGLTDEPGAGSAVHPALDPRVTGDAGPRDGQPVAAPPAGTAPTGAAPTARGAGQGLAPAEHHGVLAQLGVTASAEQSAARWYRERAARHLVPFPLAPAPAVTEPLLGALEPWEVGDDLVDVDWTGTLLRSPVVVPGVTTVRRRHEESEGADPARAPVDLDLYLDSSGSMPDPRVTGSPVALAGAVLALSALRAGARVQATTWSGPGQVAGTGGFTRDADAVLAAVVAHFGGSTSFPLPVLARTHLDRAAGRAARRRPCHVAVISDDGVVSLLGDGQEEGSSGVAARAVAAAGGGGSLVLCTDEAVAAGITARATGYDVYRVAEWEDLVTLARDFVRRTWQRGAR